jgi:hypothetical protein
MAHVIEPTVVSYASEVASPTEVASTTAMASTPAAAMCLCSRRKQASGKRSACHYHHDSSFHDILHCMGGTIRRQVSSHAGVSKEENTKRD